MASAWRRAASRRGQGGVEPATFRFQARAAPESGSETCTPMRASPVGCADQSGNVRKGLLSGLLSSGSSAPHRVVKFNWLRPPCSKSDSGLRPRLPREVANQRSSPCLGSPSGTSGVGVSCSARPFCRELLLCRVALFSHARRTGFRRTSPRLTEMPACSSIVHCRWLVVWSVHGVDVEP